jgi:hypothetical protein
MEIGFSRGAPDNPDKTWKSEINGRTYTFAKALHKKGVFLYSCEHQDETGDAKTEASFYSDRDLTSEEVEEAPQFDRIIVRRK